MKLPKLLSKTPKLFFLKKILKNYRIMHYGCGFQDRKKMGKTGAKDRGPRAWFKGRVRTFTGIDIYGRFKRREGYNVFEPIGLDGFGMHSENYALRIGAHPMRLAKVTEKNFYRQLEMIGNGFAWEEKLETYDTEYYKWTQWIFAQMFKKGLAYSKRSPVNWCPSCKTVLADEQVQSEECERCSAKIEKKDLEQWFFKITDYAERLLESLEKIDWPESIKTAQRNWIGRSEGYSLKFPLIGIPGQEDRKHSIDIFTTRPDT